MNFKRNYALIMFYMMSFYMLLVIFYILVSSGFRNLDYYKVVEFIQSYNVNRIFDLEFHYVITNRCNTDMKTILAVTSDARQVEARTAIRKAYPPGELADLGIYRVFLLGTLQPEDSIKQIDILKENIIYNDIVQGNFIDVYRNLTYKNTMGLAWAVTECKAKYIVKQDDDIAVDLYALTELISAKSAVGYDLMGDLYQGSSCMPVRNHSYKWYVTREEYPGDMYPPFLLGILYVARVEAAMKLLYAAQNTSFFWIDDVLLTGILAEKAGLVHENIRSYMKNPKDLQQCLKNSAECDFLAADSKRNFDLIIGFQKKAKTYSEFKKNLFRWQKEND